MDVEDIQAICEALPAVTQDLKWGNNLVFAVAGKIFLILGLDEAPVTASFKVSDEEFEEISCRTGFSPAPYFARYKWVWTDDIGRMTRKEWEQTLWQAYQLVKEKLPLSIKKKYGLA